MALFFIAGSTNCDSQPRRLNELNKKLKMLDLPPANLPIEETMRIKHLQEPSNRGAYYSQLEVSTTFCLYDIFVYSVAILFSNELILNCRKKDIMKTQRLNNLGRGTMMKRMMLGTDTIKSKLGRVSMMCRGTMMKIIVSSTTMMKRIGMMKSNEWMKSKEWMNRRQKNNITQVML